MDFVALFLFFSLHIFYFVVAAKRNFLLIIREKLKLQTMYERAISEGGDAMELSGIMLHARVLIFCLFFMGARKNIFVFPAGVYHNLKARSIKKLTCGSRS